MWIDLEERKFILPLVEKKHEITNVVLRKNIEDPVYGENNKIELPFRGTKGDKLIDFSFIRMLRDIVVKSQPALIHIGPTRRVIVHAMLALRSFPEIPVFVERGANGGLNALNPSDWLCFFGRRRQSIVCRSHALKANLAQKKVIGRWLPPKRLEVLHHTITATQYLSREESRADLGLEDDAFVVGTVCNVRAYKNLSTVSKAVSMLQDDYPNIRFAIIGNVEAKTEAEEIAKNGNGTVILCGHRNDANKYDKAFDVFVSPTQFGGEGFGKAIAEAMLARVPVVTGHMGAGPELIGEGAVGLIAGTHEPYSWSRAIRMLKDDPILHARLAKQAHERASHLFSVKKIASDLLGLYAKKLD